MWPQVGAARVGHQRVSLRERHQLDLPSTASQLLVSGNGYLHERRRRYAFFHHESGAVRIADVADERCDVYSSGDDRHGRHCERRRRQYQSCRLLRELHVGRVRHHEPVQRFVEQRGRRNLFVDGQGDRE